MTAPVALPAAIAVQDLLFRYGGVGQQSLSIGKLHVAAGQRVALIGASGAGKSTLLRLLDGRLRGWSGAVDVLGHQLEPHGPPPRSWRCDVGFIFQEFALLEQETVRRNVLHGRLGRTHPWRSLLARFSDADHEAALQAMHDVDIAQLGDRRVDQLSGGQRQRTAIARCLAQEPRLLLADEPVSNLDPVTADTVLGLLRDCAVARNAALLVSSHQPRLIAGFVDRFVALDRGEVVFDGPPGDLDDARLLDIYDDAHRREPV